MLEKSIWFLDESYQTPNRFGKETYYVFGGIEIALSAIESFENGLKKAVGADYWHTTEAVKESSGKSKYLEIANFIRVNSKPFSFIKQPLEQNDKLGESSRSQLIREILFESEPSTELIFEARPIGFQMDADLRILQENRRKFPQFQSREVRFVKTRDENCLWAADIVAYSARQSILGKSKLSFEILFE